MLPPRVLVLASTDRLGGGEVSLLTALDALPAERKNSVALARPAPPDGRDEDPSGLGARVRKAGLRVLPLPLFRLERPRSPAACWTLWRRTRAARRAVAEAARAWGADRLHANDSSAAWLAAGSVAPPCALSAHRRDLRVSPWLDRSLRRVVDRVAAISEPVAEAARARGHRDVRLVPNGVDTALFSPAAANAPDAPAGAPPYLLMVAQPLPWKRHDLFFRILARVREVRPDARGVLAGVDFACLDQRSEWPGPGGSCYADSDGYNPNRYCYGIFQRRSSFADGAPIVTPWSGGARAALLAQAGAAGVDDAIDGLAGLALEDMPELYRRAAVLVHPAEDEPWGRAMAEAMACGRPVVAARGGGAEDLLARGGGVRVAPGDVEAMARAVLNYLDDPVRAARDGEAGRRMVAERFSPAASARALEEFWT